MGFQANFNSDILCGHAGCCTQIFSLTKFVIADIPWPRL